MFHSRYNDFPLFFLDRAVPAPSPANAWSRPLQSKRPAGPPPGMGPPNVNSTVNAPSSSILAQNRERLLHLGLTLVGQKVVLENGPDQLPAAGQAPLSREFFIHSLHSTTFRQK